MPSFQGNMAIRIFVSHRSSDLPKLAEIRDLASASGVELYFAEHDIRPGVPLVEKVAGELERCNALLVPLTATSTASVYVQQEIGLAVGRGKPVIPLVVKEVENSSKALLEGREYILLDPTKRGEGLSRLAVALANMQEAAREGAAAMARREAHREHLAEAEAARRAAAAAKDADLQALIVTLGITVAVVLILGYLSKGGAGATGGVV